MNIIEKGLLYIHHHPWAGIALLVVLYGIAGTIEGVL